MSTAGVTSGRTHLGLEALLFMPKFVVINKITGNRETLSIDKDIIFMGRLHTNDLVLEGKSVSRKHTEISRTKNAYFVTDLESGNGTFLNGNKIKPHEKHPLKNFDRLQIEDFEIDFILPEETKVESTKTGGLKEGPSKGSSTEENTDSDIIEIKMIKKVLSAFKTEQHPMLEVLGPPCEGRRAYFTDDIQELVVGREVACQLAIDTASVSRRHAVLHKKWGGITITDLDSKNGTFVNNEKIEEKLLTDGDMIIVGAVKLKYHNPQEINLEALAKEYEKDESLLGGGLDPKGLDPKGLRQKKEGSPGTPSLAPKTSPPLSSQASQKKTPPLVSEEAKISVLPEFESLKPVKKGFDVKIKDHPSSENKPTTGDNPSSSTPPGLSNDIKKLVIPFLSRFSTLELVVMGIGFLMMVAALFALFSILF